MAANRLTIEVADREGCDRAAEFAETVQLDVGVANSCERRDFKTPGTERESGGRPASRHIATGLSGRRPDKTAESNIARERPVQVGIAAPNIDMRWPDAYCGVTAGKTALQLAARAAAGHQPCGQITISAKRADRDGRRKAVIDTAQHMDVIDLGAVAINGGIEFAQARPARQPDAKAALGIKRCALPVHHCFATAQAVCVA